MNWMQFININSAVPPLDIPDQIVSHIYADKIVYLVSVKAMQKMKDR